LIDGLVGSADEHIYITAWRS